MAKVIEEKETFTGPAKLLIPGFSVKIPDVEIEFHSPDAHAVQKRFDEVLQYLKEVLTGKVKSTKK